MSIQSPGIPSALFETSAIRSAYYIWRNEWVNKSLFYVENQQNNCCKDGKRFLSPLQDSNFPCVRAARTRAGKINNKQTKKPINIQKVAKTVKGLQKLTKCSQCVADGEPYAGKEGNYNDFPRVHVNHQRDSAITSEALGVWSSEL